MPLDAYGSAIIHGSLREAIYANGIIPIPSADLEKHMAAEIRKHPPSWFYLHSPSIELTLFLATVFAVTITVFGAALALVFGWSAFHPVCLLIAGASGLSLVQFYRHKTRGPAIWQEETYPTVDDQPMPREIRDIAQTIKRQFPDCEFSIGTLIQSRAVLDPYLIVRDSDDNFFVVGIWDGEKIISIAQQI